MSKKSKALATQPDQAKVDIQPPSEVAPEGNVGSPNGPHDEVTDEELAQLDDEVAPTVPRDPYSVSGSFAAGYWRGRRHRLDHDAAWAQASKDMSSVLDPYTYDGAHDARPDLASNPLPGH